MKIKESHFHMVLLFMMCVINALFSSSTPDQVGIPEIIIGLILISLVGVSGIEFVFFLHESTNKAVQLPGYLRISVMYLLCIPTLTGVIVSQNEMSNFIRDIIPLLYMLIPVLLYRRVQADPETWFKVVVASLSVIGVAYSVRHFTEGGGSLSQVGKEFIWGGNFDNIVQDPATMFVMSFFSGFAIWFLFKGDLFRGLLCLIVAAFPWAASIASVLRAPVGLALIVVFWAMFISKANLKKNIPMIIVVAMVVVASVLMFGGLFVDLVEGAMGLLMVKQEAVGLSSRDLEVTAVIENIDSIYILLLGEGWGGLIDSPFSTGPGWRFVHNMFLYFYFKTGLFGTIALLTYLYWLGQLVWRNLYKIGKVYLLTIIALITPLAISMVLEPMYKALTFGLVLLLIPLVGLIASRNHKMNICSEVKR